LSFDKQVKIIITVIGMIVVAGWTGYTYFSKKPVTTHKVTPYISIDGVISVDNGATQVISTGAGNVTINTKNLQDTKIIEALLASQKVKNQQASDLIQLVKELEKTIKALRAKEGQPGVQEALAFLERGDAGKAEQLFQKIL